MTNSVKKLIISNRRYSEIQAHTSLSYDVCYFQMDDLMGTIDQQEELLRESKRYHGIIKSLDIVPPPKLMRGILVAMQIR